MIHGIRILTIMMDKKTMVPNPALNKRLLLKSNLSIGKGWKKRIKRNTPRLILR